MLTRMFSAVQKRLSGKHVSDRASIAEDVLFGNASSSDTEAVLAVAQLTTALCNNKCAGVVDAGVFIFFKAKAEDGDFQIFYKRLTVRERALLNDQPSILRDPYSLLEKLDKARQLDQDRATELRKIALLEKSL